MWIFTSAGFVSAVEHRDDEKLLMVRARDEDSLKIMAQGIEAAGKAADENYGEIKIYSEGGSDYPWRAVVSKATFAIWVQFEIMNYLVYPNFKTALTAFRGEKWHRAAMNVWTDMLAVEDKPKGWAPYQHLSDKELVTMIEEGVKDADIPLTDDELAVLTDLGEGYNDHQYGEGAAVLEDDDWLHTGLVEDNKEHALEVPMSADERKAIEGVVVSEGEGDKGKGSEDAY